MIDANHSEANHLLGVIAYQDGENEDAVELIQKELSETPRKQLNKALSESEERFRNLSSTPTISCGSLIKKEHTPMLARTCIISSDIALST